MSFGTQKGGYDLSIGDVEVVLTASVGLTNVLDIFADATFVRLVWKGKRR